MADTSSIDIIQSIYNKGKSGKITLEIPNVNKERVKLEALLLSDIKIDLKNNWKTLLPQGDSFSAASQVLTNFASVASWVGLSQVVWTGSEPLTIPIEFLLISYNSSSNILSKLENLYALSCPTRAQTGSIVHGGYKPDYLDLSADGGTRVNFAGTKELITSYQTGNKILDYTTAEGTVGIRLGSQAYLKNLLLEEVSHKPSTVTVADGNPLYVKVSATFRTYRTLYAEEIKNYLRVVSTKY